MRELKLNKSHLDFEGAIEVLKNVHGRVVSERVQEALEIAILAVHAANVPIQDDSLLNGLDTELEYPSNEALYVVKVIAIDSEATQGYTSDISKTLVFRHPPRDKDVLEALECKYGTVQSFYYDSSKD